MVTGLHLMCWPFCHQGSTVVPLSAMRGHSYRLTLNLVPTVTPGSFPARLPFSQLGQDWTDAWDYSAPSVGFLHFSLVNS